MEGACLRVEKQGVSVCDGVMIIGRALVRIAVDGVGAGLCCRTCESVGPDRSRSTSAAIDCSKELLPCDGENVSRQASFDFLLISYASE